MHLRVRPMRLASSSPRRALPVLNAGAWCRIGLLALASSLASILSRPPVRPLSTGMWETLRLWTVMARHLSLPYTFLTLWRRPQGCVCVHMCVTARFPGAGVKVKHD
jgi:hypothetical protein